jgi:hypothetical protein
MRFVGSNILPWKPTVRLFTDMPVFAEISRNSSEITISGPTKNENVLLAFVLATRVIVLADEAIDGCALREPDASISFFKARLGHACCIVIDMDGSIGETELRAS